MDFSIYKPCINLPFGDCAMLDSWFVIRIGVTKTMPYEWTFEKRMDFDH